MLDFNGGINAAMLVATGKFRINPENERDHGYAEACDDILLALKALKQPADGDAAVGELADRLWNALKQRCAADPEKAMRLVFVTPEDVRAAVASAKVLAEDEIASTIIDGRADSDVRGEQC